MQQTYESITQPRPVAGANSAATLQGSAAAEKSTVRAGYAAVNGLRMYYEIHGSGQPLVLLHGAFGNTETWAPLVPGLTKTRQVTIFRSVRIIST